MAGGYTIQVDVTEAAAMLQKAGADVPRFLDELKGELANLTAGIMWNYTPRAVKKWTPETRIGELKRSIDIQEHGDAVIVGPTARHRGYPYGLAVSRGTAWGGRPAKAGPRPFAEWTFRDTQRKADVVADRVADRALQRWGGM